ncbi:alanine--tRNA ligase [Patescibacteria group bacterium]|nr:alanine--tRNA ligase [Patescibacteria group bacterium]MBU3999599.1 alanine--tRNA ligase [Patescibacteria group bacterium]MBU4056339.1 alanine--tRNA ligase [Patescibacteria group bacterium]MBU4368967.1 alanine--tRNA ligase [Patescibacteria group bacterium]
MTSGDLRKKYIEFFKKRGHKEIPSASLVPEHDPTVLFTTAGMHSLVPYLLGEKHPMGKRLVNVQKCIRTDDIEEVGDNRHLTFFEMLGNWSLDGYFKNEAITWSWEFLVDKKEGLGLAPEKIFVSAFEGDSDAPRDEEPIKIWSELFKKSGIDAKVDVPLSGGGRIFTYDKSKNFWGPAGMTGPCGPNSEMFYDTDKPHNPAFGKICHPNCDCGRFIEIWNDVFMEYNKTAGGKYVLLKQKNVDTGMGTERTLAILNGFDSVYETDVLAPIVAKIKDQIPKTKTTAHKSKTEEIKSIRIIADHTRASVFMISDGIMPSNIERGYILRRLLRRAIRHGRMLKMPENFLAPLIEVVINIYKENYSDLNRNKTKILNEIKKEEGKFEKTLEAGMREFKKIEWVGVADEALPKRGSFAGHAEPQISGKVAFNLYQTYGFPIELTLELAKEQGRLVDISGFQKELRKHQELSRTAAAGKFKGGLSDQGEQAVKYHTATHLLLAALRKVLGEHIYQRGSNITAERLRFDFSHPEKMTKEQIQKVEDLVNEQIQKNLSVSFAEMALEDAKRLGATHSTSSGSPRGIRGAMGIFETKYGERVKVYAIGDEKTGIFSREICGGPHAANTGILGKFKIQKEEASSSGVRRIKAVLE